MAAQGADPGTGQATAGGVSARMILPGILILTGLTICTVFLRGLRWDENYEYAQIILNQIAYPEGHPFNQIMKGLYSMQTYSLAALMALIDGPTIPNAVRNSLSLLATVLPPFLVAVVFTRRQILGYAASVLTLIGVHVMFVSTYPINTWPNEYSNGHVGTGYAVVALALFLAGYRRTFFFLLGLMVSVHLAQLPGLFGFLLIYLLMCLLESRRTDLRTAVAWTVVGLLPSVALWLYTRWAAVPPPDAGPYFSPISPDLVYQRYQIHHASHRMFPVLTGHIALIGALLLCVPCAFLERRAGVRRGPWFWTGLYVTICALAVWSVMAVHGLLGEDTPFLLLGWMPYRLMNHVTVMLVPLSLAALTPLEERDGPGGTLVAVTLLAALVLLLARGPIGDAGVLLGRMQQLEFSEGLLFALFGMAAAFTALRLLKIRGMFIPWISVFGAGVLLLALTHHACLVRTVGEPLAAARSESYPVLFAALCLVAGFVAGILVEGRKISWPDRWPLLVLTCLLAVVMLHHEYQRRQHLPTTPIQTAIREYLEDRGETSAMILVPYQQQSLQSRLAHPVMTDMGAFNWIPYKPSVGPSHYKMYRELYGINLAPEEGEAAYPGPHWESYPEKRVWPQRSREDWRALGREYDFRYILAPGFMRLRLPAVLRGGGFTFYQIPGESES